MRKEENLCLMKRESEIFKVNCNKKLNKQVIITKIMLLYKERVNLQLMKWNDSKLKCKDNEDKQWPKKSILAKNLNRWKDKLKTWDNYIVLSKEKLKNIKLTQDNLKEKANNLSEQLSKWVDKAICNKNNFKKSEDNMKAREEKVHQLRLQFWISKNKIRDLTMKFEV